MGDAALALIHKGRSYTWDMNTDERGLWHACSVCKSIHPVEMMSRDDPFAVMTIHAAGREIVAPRADWIEFTLQGPGKLFLAYSDGIAHFVPIHLLDAPDVIPSFNERFGFLGYTFHLSEEGVLSWSFLDGDGE